ncbi:MAG: glycosyl hydrolase 43 family protein [Chitinophagaceae bacterium]|nr:MAG: glycosyl hydrolase 43 family protein [Chitinophagaceae bacterium]
MVIQKIFTCLALATACCVSISAQQAVNPVIFADVPDASIVRAGNTWYMSSTTMHMNPGVPVMKSTDLVNWTIVRYAYDTLANIDEMNLVNNRSAYGKGTWASCIRYHKGRFYLSTFAQTTGKTYIFSTDNIEKGKWTTRSFSPSYHDHSLFFDDDGKAYLIYGAGTLKIVTLNDDLSGIVPGSERILIEDASKPAGENIGLRAEGSQLFRVQGKYYLFNITWPKGGMRTVVIHRADRLTGPWEGRVGLQDLGVAQGGLIDTPDGRWYSYLFRDYGAVGRIPYLVPVTWTGGWPVLGVNGRVPDTLDLPVSRGLIPGIVCSDDFNRNGPKQDLPLAWQWNHNPDNRYWSLHKRKGYLRLQTGRIDSSFVKARNTLTQRTFGPASTASVALDLKGMKDGDVAGLGILQEFYGFVAVKTSGTTKEIIMTSGGSEMPAARVTVPASKSRVYLRTDCNFTDRKDEAMFYFSFDGKQWEPIGTTLKMRYTLTHFMGARFALFNYATKNTGGYADFDYFRISDNVKLN